MQKTTAMLLIMCMLLCITACNQNSTSSNSTKETENITVDENYNEALNLIDSAQYEEAYNKIKDIKDKKIAEELKSKFVIIENVLLSKTIVVPDDKFGNKIGPYNINYSYDKNGNLIEIDAKDAPYMFLNKKTANHLMKYVHVRNYHPYHEKLTYDEDNNLTKITGYSNNSEKIIYTADFIYDEKGKNSIVEYTYNMGTIQTSFEYNEKNQLIQAKGPDFTIFIQYDNNGNVIDEGTIYDDKGNVIESKTYYYSGGTTTEARCIWNYGDFYIYSE